MPRTANDAKGIPFISQPSKIAIRQEIDCNLDRSHSRRRAIETVCMETEPSVQYQTPIVAMTMEKSESEPPR